MSTSTDVSENPQWCVLFIFCLVWYFPNRNFVLSKLKKKIYVPGKVTSWLLINKPQFTYLLDFEQHNLRKENPEEKKRTKTGQNASLCSLTARSLDLAQKRFSVKRLIRLLHIKEPVFHVMAILEKK